MPMIEFQSKACAESNEATYSTSGLSLVYRHGAEDPESSSHEANRIGETLGIRRDADFLLIADTLVISFSRETRELVGFDAYTNRERWKQLTGIAYPKISGVGRVRLTHSLPEGRLDLRVIPDYAYSDAQSLLDISMNREPEGTEYYRVSHGLVVGIAGGLLTRLLVHDLATVP